MSYPPRQKRFGGKFKKRTPDVPIEKKIESFILRNSNNGYFTKISTVTSKFNISESETWSIVGMLMSEGTLESIHDPTSGEMKMCEADKKYEVLGMGKRRRFENQRDGQKKHNPDGNFKGGNYDKNKNNNKNQNRRRVRRGGSSTPNRRGGGAGTGSGRDRGHMSHAGKQSKK